nr:immunoglobulin heavy chain junction region [Mus musculus]MBK4186870.1 immunoglobulin heavy chain junction region [Mus musculus]MBK4186871.1 immunoglobulin heavy chain junction region [Mus musculus]MBK4186872.1 immunoglobulin heavy chain junction region [Mus musculus]MBK4186873.1 immunoglobulin heavy chain junction region [Mus musculus]
CARGPNWAGFAYW